MTRAAASLDPGRAEAVHPWPDGAADLCRAVGLVPLYIDHMGRDDLFVLSRNERMHVVMRGATDSLLRLARMPNVTDVWRVAALDGTPGHSILRRDLFHDADLCLAETDTDPATATGNDAAGLTPPAMAALLDATAQAQRGDHGPPPPWAALLAEAPALATRATAPAWAEAVIGALSQDAARALSDAPVAAAFGEAVPCNLVFSRRGEVAVLNIRAACLAPLGYDLASAVLWSLEQGGRAGADAWAAALRQARGRATTAQALDGILARLGDLVALRCLWLLRQRCTGGNALDPVAVTGFLEFALATRIEAAALGHAWQTERGAA